MFILLYMLLSCLRARASPIDTGPATIPTIAHTILAFGLQTRSDCSGSDMRTLYDVIRSCFFTIAACVYRAIHQNIPDPTATKSRCLMVRVKIAFYAVIAPELVIWWAMRQRFGAKIVAEVVNKLSSELNWTETHGHFAQMGGFARKDNKHVLYPEKLFELLKNGQLDLEALKLTQEDIEDKSKGDILSKGVVAFQTTWFVFECLARLQQRLPLIELEVVTLAFATLNVITYALWWHKPLNVLRPIYLHVNDRPNRSTASPHPSPPPLISVHAPSAPDLKSSPIPPPTKACSATWVAYDPTESDDDYSDDEEEDEKPGVMDKVVAVVQEDVRHLCWWGMLWKWFVKRPFLAVGRPLLDLFNDEEVHDRVTHVSTFYGMQIPQGKYDLVEMLSCFIGMVFGAIHFLSWHATFPTHIELLLWRTSSLVLVVQPFVMLLANVGNELYVRSPEETYWEKFALFLRELCYRISFFIGAVPYILARFCLIVLAFLTLPDIPPRGFDSIVWTSYIPHL